MRGTQGVGGMFSFGECHQTFWNVLKDFGECRQTLQGIGNVAKHSRECPQILSQTFHGMSSKNPEDDLKREGGYRQTFRGMSSNILGSDAKHSEKCPQTDFNL